MSTFDGSNQVYVPEELRPKILRLEHQSPQAEHPRINRMYASMRRPYYWETLANDVHEYVEDCPSCAQNRITQHKKTSQLRLFPAAEPFTSLSMDILGPLPETTSGSLNLLIICDRFTKFTRAIPLATIKAVDVSSALSEYWITAYGPPDSILTDSGPQFASEFFQGVCGLMSIKNRYTTTYHSQTNGKVERLNWTLVDMLRHYVEEH